MLGSPDSRCCISPGPGGQPPQMGMNMMQQQQQRPFQTYQGPMPPQQQQPMQQQQQQQQMPGQWVPNVRRFLLNV